MRPIAAALFILLAGISQVQASTLRVRLVPAADNATPGLFHVAIQVQSVVTTDGSQGDGGVSGMRFDVISEGHGLSNAVRIGAGPSLFKVKIAWSISANDFSQFAPDWVDAMPANNPGDPRYTSDGDIDAIGGAFFDPANISNTQIGITGYQTIATIDWQLTFGGIGDRLDVNVLGPTYYDFSAVNSNFQRPYTFVESLSSGGVIPEPMSAHLAAVGCLVF